MPNITLSIPQKMYQNMKKYPEIRWSEVARKSIQKEIDCLEMLEIIKLSEDAEIAYKKGDLIKESEILKELGIDENDL
jgi:transcriptional regulator of met regulon